MIRIDSIRCTGCGGCIDVCSQHAISFHNDLVIINQEQCIQCGTCVEACPVGAIREVASIYTQVAKGGEKMVYGFGRGSGRRGGAGFGFRGATPPWPYVGRGRGGLPRCSYPGVAMASSFQTTPPLYTPQMTQEGGIGWLKSQTDAIKAELNRVEARINELETGK